MCTVYTNTRLLFGVYLQWYQIFPSAVYSIHIPTSTLVYAKILLILATAVQSRVIIIVHTLWW